MGPSPEYPPPQQLVCNSSLIVLYLTVSGDGQQGIDREDVEESSLCIYERATIPAETF